MWWAVPHFCSEKTCPVFFSHMIYLVVDFAGPPPQQDCCGPVPLGPLWPFSPCCWCYRTACLQGLPPVNLTGPHTWYDLLLSVSEILPKVKSRSLTFSFCTGFSRSRGCPTCSGSLVDVSISSLSVQLSYNLHSTLPWTQGVPLCLLPYGGLSEGGQGPSKNLCILLPPYPRPMAFSAP